MSYGYLLTLLGLLLAVGGVVEGGWWLLLTWLGLNFLLVGIAHTRHFHGIFGKRSDGTLPWWSWLVYWPLLALTFVAWNLVRLISREPARSAITDQLVVGRRLSASEHEEGFDNYVDLTAEFAEPRCARTCAGYRSFPILDGGAPRPEALCSAVRSLRPGRTLVHCAQGHGRAGLFALAMLLNSGAVRSVDEGLRVLRAVRPGIRLTRRQRRCIEQCVELLAAGRQPTPPVTRP